MAEMTKKDFLELLQEFSKKTLDPKFEKIDSKFEGWRFLDGVKDSSPYCRDMVLLPMQVRETYSHQRI